MSQEEVLFRILEDLRRTDLHSTSYARTSHCSSKWEQIEWYVDMCKSCALLRRL